MRKEAVFMTRKNRPVAKISGNITEPLFVFGLVIIIAILIVIDLLSGGELLSNVVVYSLMFMAWLLALGVVISLPVWIFYRFYDVALRIGKRFTNNSVSNENEDEPLDQPSGDKAVFLLTVGLFVIILIMSIIDPLVVPDPQMDSNLLLRALGYYALSMMFFLALLIVVSVPFWISDYFSK